MRILIVAAALAASLVAVADASAQSRCKVTDPTGTPLNVRAAPQGAIIGKIANGRVVQTIDSAFDANGKPWSHIATMSGQPIGWVFREFVSCY